MTGSCRSLLWRPTKSTAQTLSYFRLCRGSEYSSLFFFLRLFIHQLFFFGALACLIKISFKSFVQAFFCWFLTCVYHIYWINIHWYWNLSAGVIANCKWAVSKPYIRIYFPSRFLEGRGRGAGFFDFTSLYQYIYWLQGSYSSSTSLELCRQVLSQGAQSNIGLIDCNFFVLYIKIVCFIFMFVKNFCFLSRPKGHKGPLG